MSTNEKVKKKPGRPKSTKHENLITLRGVVDKPENPENIIEFFTSDIDIIKKLFQSMKKSGTNIISFLFKKATIEINYANKMNISAVQSIIDCTYTLSYYCGREDLEMCVQINDINKCTYSINNSKKKVGIIIPNNEHIFKFVTIDEDNVLIGDSCEPKLNELNSDSIMPKKITNLTALINEENIINKFCIKSAYLKHKSQTDTKVKDNEGITISFENESFDIFYQGNDNHITETKLPDLAPLRLLNQNPFKIKLKNQDVKQLLNINDALLNIYVLKEENNIVVEISLNGYITSYVNIIT